MTTVTDGGRLMARVQDRASGLGFLLPLVALFVVQQVLFEWEFRPTEIVEKGKNEETDEHASTDQIDDREAGRRAFEYLIAEQVFGPKFVPIDLCEEDEEIHSPTSHDPAGEVGDGSEPLDSSGKPIMVLSVTGEGKGDT